MKSVQLCTLLNVIIMVLFVQSSLAQEETRPASSPIRKDCGSRQTITTGPATTYVASVATSNNRLAVGHTDTVSVYTLGSSWTLRHTINPPDENSTSSFGQAVAMSGEWLVVGQPTWTNSDGDVAGMVWAYRWSGNEFAYFGPVPASTANKLGGAKFGWTMAMWNNTLIVGAPGCCAPGTTGGAFVYRFNGTDWDPKSFNGIAQPGLLSGDEFGWGVAVGDEYVYVTSPKSLLTGNVYFYKMTEAGTPIVGDVTIPVVGALVPDMQENAFCGFSLSRAANHRVAFGCPSYDNDTGIVYVANEGPGQGGTVYYSDGYLMSPNPTPGEKFGLVVSNTQNSLIVGTNNDTLYIYEYTVDRVQGSGWNHRQTIYASTPGQSFGASVEWVLDVQAEAAAGYVDVYDCPAPKSSAVSVSASLLSVALIALAALVL